MKRKITMLENGLAKIDITSPPNRYGRVNSDGWLIVREPGSLEFKEPYVSPVHLNEDGTYALYVKGQCDVEVYDWAWNVLEMVHNIVQVEAALVDVEVVFVNNAPTAPAFQRVPGEDA